jgi:hypothetical protein
LTDLEKLSYSLTKFGAFKIAYLIHDYRIEQLFSKLANNDYGLIDAGQTKKILSAPNANNIPAFWEEVKSLGVEDIFDIIFLSIILSHHQLIKIISESFDKGNVIKRNDFPVGIKPYTNFFRASKELGFVTDFDDEKFRIDISRILYKDYMPSLVLELINLKLISAGWDRSNTLLEEVNRLNLYKVFGLDKASFINWITENTDDDFYEQLKKPARKLSVRHFLY